MGFAVNLDVSLWIHRGHVVSGRHYFYGPSGHRGELSRERGPGRSCGDEVQDDEEASLEHRTQSCHFLQSHLLLARNGSAAFLSKEALENHPINRTIAQSSRDVRWALSALDWHHMDEICGDDIRDVIESWLLFDGHSLDR